MFCSKQANAKCTFRQKIWSYWPKEENRTFTFNKLFTAWLWSTSLYYNSKHAWTEAVIVFCLFRSSSLNWSFISPKKPTRKQRQTFCCVLIGYFWINKFAYAYMYFYMTAWLIDSDYVELVIIVIAFTVQTHVGILCHAMIVGFGVVLCSPAKLCQKNPKLEPVIFSLPNFMSNLRKCQSKQVIKLTKMHNMYTYLIFSFAHANSTQMWMGNKRERFFLKAK